MSDVMPDNVPDFVMREDGSVSYVVVVPAPRLMSSREIFQLFEAITLTTAVVYYADQRNASPSDLRLQGAIFENARVVHASYGSPVFEEVVQILNSGIAMAAGAPLALYSVIKVLKAGADAFTSSWTKLSEAKLKSLEVKKVKLDMAASQANVKAGDKDETTARESDAAAADTLSDDSVGPGTQDLLPHSLSLFRPSRAELQGPLAAMRDALDGSDSSTDQNLDALLERAEEDLRVGRRTVVLRAVEALILLARWDTIIEQTVNEPLESDDDEQGSIETADSEE